MFILHLYTCAVGIFYGFQELLGYSNRETRLDAIPYNSANATWNGSSITSRKRAAPLVANTLTDVLRCRGDASSRAGLMLGVGHSPFLEFLLGRSSPFDGSSSRDYQVPGFCHDGCRAEFWVRSLLTALPVSSGSTHGPAPLFKIPF